MGQLLTKGARQLGVASAGLLLFAAIYKWPVLEPHAWFEANATFYWLAAGLFLWTVCAAVLWPELWAWWRRGWPETARGRGLLVALAALTAFYVVTHSQLKYRMLGDEHNHLSVAQGMYVGHTAQRCEEGHFFEGELRCSRWDTELRPKAFALMLWAVYGLIGERTLGAVPTAGLLNLFLYLAVGVLLFRLARQMGFGAAVGTAAWIAWSLWPLNAWWARTGGYEMAYCFWLVLTLAIALWIAESGESDLRLPWKAVFLGLTASFASQTRMEGYLTVIPVLVPAIPRLWNRWGPGCLALATWIAASVPGVVVRGIFRDSRIQAPPGDDPFMVKHLLFNLPRGLEVMLNWTGQWPSVSTLFVASLAGAAVLAREAWRAPRGAAIRLASAAIFAWFALQSLVIFSCFNGDFTIFVSMRYATGIYPMLALFAACAVGAVLAASERRGLRFPGPLLGVGAAAVALFHGAYLEGNRLLRLVHLTTESELIQEVVKTLDRNSVFVYSRAPELLLQNRAGYTYGQLTQLLPAQRSPWWETMIRRSGGNLYYVRGLDCWHGLNVKWVEMHLPNECESIERKFRLKEAVKRRVADDFDLIFYKVEGFQ